MMRSFVTCGPTTVLVTDPVYDTMMLLLSPKSLDDAFKPKSCHDEVLLKALMVRACQ